MLQLDCIRSLTQLAGEESGVIHAHMYIVHPCCIVQYLYSYIHSLPIRHLSLQRSTSGFRNPRSSYPNGRPYNNPPTTLPTNLVPPSHHHSLSLHPNLFFFISLNIFLIFFFWPLLNLSKLPSGAIILSFNFLVNLSCLILSPVVIPKKKKIENRKSTIPPSNPPPPS